MRRRQHRRRREEVLSMPNVKSKHRSSLHTTGSLNNWQLHVHLTILLLPIAGGTSDPVYVYVVTCIVYRHGTHDYV